MRPARAQLIATVRGLFPVRSLAELDSALRTICRAHAAILTVAVALHLAIDDAHVGYCNAVGDGTTTYS